MAAAAGAPSRCPGLPLPCATCNLPAPKGRQLVRRCSAAGAPESAHRPPLHACTRVQNAGLFDAVDLDPYGSPSILLDSAVQVGAGIMLSLQPWCRCGYAALSMRYVCCWPGGATACQTWRALQWPAYLPTTPCLVRRRSARAACCWSLPPTWRFCAATTGKHAMPSMPPTPCTSEWLASRWLGVHVVSCCQRWQPRCGAVGVVRQVVGFVRWSWLSHGRMLDWQ